MFVFNAYWYLCIKSNYKCLIKVSTLNAQFTSFYYKELLQKMQVSIFEKYIPYMDSKETML